MARRVLLAASRLLKPGGRRVYATCSLLEEENEEFVSAFLNQRADFRQLDCAALQRAVRIALHTGPLLRRFPHRHGTDGFFAAVLGLAPR